METLLMARKPPVVPPSRQWRVLGFYQRPAGGRRPFVCNKLVIAAYPDSTISKAQQRLAGTTHRVRGPSATPPLAP